MILYLRLFYEFFKAGLFAVGGGLATLPFLYDISDRTAWFSHGQLADMVAVSESTPGAIGVNMATYVGFTTGGLPGAAAATAGLVAPSLIIIVLIARFLKRFSEDARVQAAMYGLRAASAALIAAAGVLVAKLSLLDAASFRSGGGLASLFRWKALLLALLLYPAMKKLKLHPVFFLAFSALAGIAFRFAAA